MTKLESKREKKMGKSWRQGEMNRNQKTCKSQQAKDETKKTNKKREKQERKHESMAKVRCKKNDQRLCRGWENPERK